MKVFTIDTANEISAFSIVAEANQDIAKTDRFTDETELGALAQTWPATRLVEIWNSLPGVEPVHKFTSRSVAVRRIWKAIQHLQPAGGALARPVASKNPAQAKTPGKTRRAAPLQSKAAKVIGLLQRTEGVTLRQIMRATGWQAHTVRGFISGHLKKKLGLKVRSFKRDGERVYAIKG